MSLICRFCGQSTVSKALISVLDYDIDEKSPEPNLRQKIAACLPVHIHCDDVAPKKICADCCKKTHATYEFIQMMLTAQKFLEIGPNTPSTRVTRSALKKRTVSLEIEKLESEKSETDTDAYAEPESRGSIVGVLERLQKSGSGITIKRRAVPSSTIVATVQTEPAELVSKQESHALADGLDLLDDSSDADYSPGNESASPEAKPQSIAAHKSMPKTIILNVEAPPIYVCLMCKARFPSFEPLKEHMRNNKRCKEIYLKCNKCQKVFETRKGLQQHFQTHKNKPQLVCEQCGKTFTHQFNLENHKSSQHGEYVDELGSIYRCKECDDQFTNRRDLYEHISQHVKQPTPVLCDYCGRSFKSSESLRLHKRIHLDIRPYPCTYCTKRFRSRLQMTQHLHVHTGVKLFKCVYCNKEFAKKDSLVAHTRTHTGDLPYQCSYCSEKFSTISKRKTHCRSQHAEELPGADAMQTLHVEGDLHLLQSDDVIDSSLEPVMAVEVEPLHTTTTSYVTYSTAFIDSDNILVFEHPVDVDIPLAVIQ